VIRKIRAAWREWLAPCPWCGARSKHRVDIGFGDYHDEMLYCSGCAALLEVRLDV
jgi:hypothetical protein